MQVSDLFDAHTRDQAVKELPDDSLVLASLMQLNEHPTCPLQREWLANDVIWYAMHCRSAHNAGSILRSALASLHAEELHQAFLRVSHYRKPERDLRKPPRDTHGEVAHLLSVTHGQAMLDALVGMEIHAAASGSNPSPIAWEYILRFCTNADLLQEAVTNFDVTSASYAIKRLEELGEHQRLAELAVQVPSIARFIEPR